jgi:AcrR family transcriptional regulator
MKVTDMRREREVRRREGYHDVILHAAERVILRKGFGALTMDDVASEAQLSKATVYKYIAGKGALLHEIMGRMFDDIRERFAASVEGVGSAREKLGRLVQVVLESGEAMKGLNRALWMDDSILRLMRVFVTPLGKTGAASAGDRKLLATLRGKRQELIGLGARVIEEGVASGEFRRMDTAQASVFIEAVLQGYMHMRFWEGDVPLPPGAAENLTRFIVEGIRDPELAVKEI